MSRPCAGGNRMLETLEPYMSDDCPIRHIFIRGRKSREAMNFLHEKHGGDFVVVGENFDKNLLKFNRRIFVVVEEYQLLLWSGAKTMILREMLRKPQQCQIILCA